MYNVRTHQLYLPDNIAVSYFLQLSFLTADSNSIHHPVSRLEHYDAHTFVKASSDYLKNQKFRQKLLICWSGASQLSYYCLSISADCSEIDAYLYMSLADNSMKLILGSDR